MKALLAGILLFSGFQFAIAAWAQTAPGAARASTSQSTDGELDLGQMVQPVPMDAKFADPKWNIWCGAPIRTADGKCHLYYSRWPANEGFSPGWAIHSEIAYALADQPQGPYRFVNVALPARGIGFWDGAVTHNPVILQVNGKFYLFYMGNTGDGNYVTHRNNQRIGVAVADKPEGPWTRFAKPIVDVSPDRTAFDSLCVTNPAVAVRPDGGILLIYKAVEYVAGKPMGGIVRYGAALADHPEGPYTKATGRIFEAEGGVDKKTWMLAEDPFVWFSRKYGNRYYAVACDVVGRFTGAAGGIALFQSEDGLHWQPATHPRVLGQKFLWSDGAQSSTHIERPALLFDGEEPVALFGATNGYTKTPSFNVQIPLNQSSVPQVVPELMPHEFNADVIVYGATPAGIIAAIAASREGARAIVIEPGKWIGGMVTGGLSRTDTGRAETIGGYTREFFARAANSYRGKFMWDAEPHVNLATFEEMLREARVSVIKEARLKSVAREGRRIVSITTGDDRTYTASQFIDASYEGDLMAAAKVSYVVGRESNVQYGEPLAGYLPMPIRPRTVEVMNSECPCLGGKGPHYIHGTPAAISGIDDAGKPIYGVYAAPTLEPGCADKLTQSYNFRICVTRRPEIRVPFPKPMVYEASRYELLLRLIKLYPGIRFGRLFHLGDIANGKYDLNAQGLFSTDDPGANTDYPDGDILTRARIWQDHVDFTQGLLWFLGHDERVPQSLREETNTWGLCRDEFADNGHWPYALYVREARRMVGEYVMVQKDCQESTTKPDGVAMGSFVIDCHIVERILAPDGTVRDEGSFQDAPVKPYQIPYRSLCPRRTECENLLVPVCLSASHIAYCSLRMEPVYMATGHAAGVASVMAMRNHQAVQAIDVAALQATLRKEKAVLDLSVEKRDLWPTTSPVHSRQ